MLDIYAKRENDGRTRPSREKKTYDVKKLWQGHHEAINLLSLGMRHKDVANILGVTEATISNIANSTLGREKLGLLRGARDSVAFDAATEIQNLVPKCLETLNEILQSEGEDAAPRGMKLNVAKHVLKDLSGHAAPKRIDARHLHHTLQPDDLERIKERGRELQAAASIVVND